MNLRLLRFIFSLTKLPSLALHLRNFAGGKGALVPIKLGCFLKELGLFPCDTQSVELAPADFEGPQSFSVLSKFIEGLWILEKEADFEK